MTWRPFDCEEIAIPPAFFAIANAQYEIWENAPATPSNNIIRIGTTWGVHVQWQNSGFLIPFLNPAISWRITCFLEQYGPAEGPPLPLLAVPFNISVALPSPPNFAQYDTNVTFPAALVPEGTFRFAVRIRLVGPPPLSMPIPLGCVADGPMLDFYPG
jgi:hypothetical protein